VVAFDDTVVSDGSRGRVTGSVTCDAGRVFALNLTVTQGSARGTCTGSPQPFAIDFTAGNGTFIAGSTEASWPPAPPWPGLAASPQPARCARRSSSTSERRVSSAQGVLAPEGTESCQRRSNSLAGVV
jgi:hypothetical protein